MDVRRLHRLGAGDDLDQFLGNHRLARSVIGQRLLANHFAGVSGGIVHRRHLRTVEGCHVLHQGAENLHRDVARQEFLEDVLLLRLVFVDRAGSIGRDVAEIQPVSVAAPSGSGR